MPIRSGRNHPYFGKIGYMRRLALRKRKPFSMWKFKTARKSRKGIPRGPNRILTDEERRQRNIRRMTNDKIRSSLVKAMMKKKL